MAWMVPAAMAASSLVGAASSNKAANTQAAAADKAAQLQQAQYLQNRTDAAPYRQAGYTALSQLMNGMGMSTPGMGYNDDQRYLHDNPDVAADPYYATHPLEHYQQHGMAEGRASPWVDLSVPNGGATDTRRSFQPGFNVSGGPGGTSDPNGAGFGDLSHKFSLSDFVADPGYQFRLDQGMRGVEASAAARGGLLSGAALKGLTDYSQNFASNEFQNAYNRYSNDQTNRFNRLSALAGIGQTANSQLAANGSNTATAIGENMMGGANARASGYIGATNSINNGVSSIGNFYQQQQMMNRMFPNGSGYPTMPYGGPGGYGDAMGAGVGRAGSYVNTGGG